MLSHLHTRASEGERYTPTSWNENSKNKVQKDAHNWWALIFSKKKDERKKSKLRIKSFSNISFCERRCFFVTIGLFFWVWKLFQILEDPKKIGLNARQQRSLQGVCRELAGSSNGNEFLFQTSLDQCIGFECILFSFRAKIIRKRQNQVRSVLLALFSHQVSPVIMRGSEQFNQPARLSGVLGPFIEFRSLVRLKAARKLSLQSTSEKVIASLSCENFWIVFGASLSTCCAQCIQTAVQVVCS